MEFESTHHYSREPVSVLNPNSVLNDFTDFSVVIYQIVWLDYQKCQS